MMKIDKFEIKLLNTIKKYNMLCSGDRVLVALSGGKDSVALTHALNKLSSKLGISVFAFHLNHGIRGQEADADENLAKCFCDELSIPFASAYADVPSMSQTSSDGLEAVARDVRYKELRQAADKFGCNKIATAHTASDNSETLFITLSRNSFAKGIPPVRDNIVRPLICHTTKEVLDYCSANKLEFATDSTNSDDSYTRNYIRHKVLPQVYGFSPSFDENSVRFSDIQRSNAALVEMVAKKYYEKNNVPVSLNSLRTLSNEECYYNVLYYVVCSYFNISLSYCQFDELVYLLKNGRTGQKVSIGEGAYLKLGYDNLEYQKDVCDVEDYEFEIKLGKNPIPHSNLSLWFETAEEFFKRTKENELKNLKVNKLTKNILIKYNIINSSLVARSRINGDSYICRGINRSVKKYMIDEKIPSELRSRIPIVCDSAGIVWVPGLGVADRIKENNTDGDSFSLSVDFEKN